MYSTWNFEALEQLKDPNYNEIIAFPKFKNGEVTLEYILAQNYKLCFDFLKKYLLSVNLTYEEKLSLVIQGMIKAINIFDTNKGFTFSTLAYKIMYNNILMELRRVNKSSKIKTVSIDSKIKDDKQENNKLHISDMIVDCSVNVHKTVEESDSIIQMKSFMSKLPQKEREILELRYFQDKNQDDIAKIVGVSQSYVSRLEKKAIKFLKNKMEMVS